MNSTQIRCILTNNIPGFEVGVFASDQLRYIQSNKFAIVVNSDDSSKPGTHWLAIFRDGKQIEFFDSFSFPPSFYSINILRFLKKYNRKFKTSNYQVQSNFSVMCGHFCVYFLINRSLGISFKEIIHSFSKSKLIENDDKVYKFVQTNFQRSHCNNEYVDDKDEPICILQCCKTYKYSLCKD